MNLADIIIINRMVMELINLKYPENFNFKLESSKSADGRYYELLERDIERAEQTLGEKAPGEDTVKDYLAKLRALAPQREK